MSAAIQPLELPEVRLLQPRRFHDERGWFMETFRHDWRDSLGPVGDFVQDNHAATAKAGTLRGMHYQAPPFAQAKLVRVVRGSIFDVAVDLRRGSPRYGRWVGVTLSAEEGRQLFVPAGFAHGYCTLEPDTEVAYKCDAYYAPDAEGGVHPADPDLAIEWPRLADMSRLSPKDSALPWLRDLASPFSFGAGPDTTGRNR